jgi:hypothetical protein
VYLNETIDSSTGSFPQTTERLVDIYRESLGSSDSLIDACDESVMSRSDVASAVTQYLWRLSDSVSKWLQLHSPPYKLIDNEYIALQIRLTDKRNEMGEEAWSVLSNSSALTDLALLHAFQLNISTIFVATDDCGAFESLLSEVQSRTASAHFRVVGACLDLEEGKDVSDYAAHSGGGAMHLIQDLEILRRSAVLIGTLYSNIFRVVYRLRYPDHRVVNVADEYFVFNKATMIDTGLCWYIPNCIPGSRHC